MVATPDSAPADSPAPDSAPAASPPAQPWIPYPAPIYVDTLAGLDAFLAVAATAGTLCIDLEGQELSRFGTLDIISVLPLPAGASAARASRAPVYVISVHKLGEAAFNHYPTHTLVLGR
jgi:hypothetical protein